jgi:hypothetical protein
VEPNQQPALICKSIFYLTCNKIASVLEQHEVTQMFHAYLGTRGEESAVIGVIYGATHPL